MGIGVMRMLKSAEQARYTFVMKLLQHLPVFLLLVLVVLLYSNTVDDTDFWWHLKQGEFIYMTHGIPAKDEFSSTTYIADRVANEVAPATDRILSPAENKTDFWIKNNLKLAWLGQLLFYTTYHFLGIPGLAVFKACIFALAFLAAYLSMLKRGSAPLAAFLVLALIALIAADFNYTRPQIFSFLLFPCMLYTLYDFRAGGRTIYGLPVLMLFWANLHGGFILGVIVLIVFAFAETVKYLMSAWFHRPVGRSLEWHDVRKLLIVTLLSVAASLLSPNGYGPFLFPLIQMHSVFSAIEEYRRPMLYEYHAYWGMLALVVCSIIIAGIRRRLDLTELAVAAIVIFASYNGLRFIPFLALGTAPFLSFALTSASRWMGQTGFMANIAAKRAGLAQGARILVPLLICAILVVTMARDIISGRVLRAEVREQRYPSGAVDFIRKNEPHGNMFNQFNWGGYLIWTLGPRYKTFVDGRCTSENAFLHYNYILAAADDANPPHPLWKRLLDAYEVNLILVSAVSTAGVIHPLVDKLYIEPKWELVFADGKSLIFLRDTPEHRPIIDSYRISKETIIDEIIAECEAGIRETPATWGYYEILGYTYFKKNRSADALRMFDKYLSMNPRNENIRGMRDTLRGYAAPTPPSKLGDDRRR
jgi:hypothetical protein